MSHRWQERVEGHPVRGELEGLSQLITEASPITSEDSLRELRRLARITALAEAHLANTDPELVSQRMLDELSTAIRSTSDVMRELIQQAQSSQNADWPRANDVADQILAALSTWPPLQVAQHADALRRATEQLASRAEELLGSLRSNVDQLAARTQKIEEQGKAAADEIAQRIEKARVRLDELSATIDQEKARLDAQIQSHESMFSQAQEDRRQQFDAMITSQRQALESALNDIRETSETQANDAREAAQSHLDELARLRDEAKELVGVIGRTGMSGGYQKDAEAEGKAADLWRRWTVGLVIAAIVVLGATAILASASVLDLRRSLTNWALTGLFGAAATYTARESSRHRRNARRARSIELALASIGPYLEPLPAERRHQVLEQLVDVFFGQLGTTEGSGEVVGSGSVRALTDLLGKIQSEGR